MKIIYEKLRIRLASKEEPKKSNRPFHYGFAILKSVMAFLVIVFHQFNKKTTKNKLILFITKKRRIHVPCFFILSFYFMHYSLFPLNPKKIFITRMYRLLIPYIGWPLITFVINKKYNKIFKQNLPDNIDILKKQLLFGFGFLIQFWYLWDLIACTIIFAIVIYTFKKYGLFVLQLMLVLSYALQYSGYYYKYMNKSQHCIRYSVGRIPEMIPYGVSGIILGFYNIINYLQKYKIKTFIFSFMTYNIITDYKVLYLNII